MAVKVSGRIDWPLIGQKLELAAFEARQQPGGFPFTVDVPYRISDPLAWLAALPLFPKVYWRSRDGSFEVAAAGVVRTVSKGNGRTATALSSLQDSLNRVPRFSRPVVLGGLAFDASASVRESWPGFPDSWFFQPALAYVREEGNTELRIGVALEPDRSREQLLSHLQTALAVLPQRIPDLEPLPQLSPVKRRDFPSREDWLKEVKQALTEIESGSLTKVVLARMTELEFPALLPWPVLFRKLCETGSNAFQYLFAPSEEAVFMGATPERLFRLTGSQLLTEALSGTAPRAKSPQEDQASARFLLQDPKNLLEHRHVVNYLRERLTPLSRTLSVADEPGLFRLPYVQHLYTPVSARLNLSATVGEVLQSLHPTPAVCGLPAPEAMAFIREHEPFSRGWYAGAVGVFTRRSAEFAVAIRSFLVRGKVARLFAGAGIVPGSDPEKEWREVESKISAPAGILGAAP